ncbi:NUMOD4 motif-containing HNH endonuclease [Lactococcus lactis]|uniref:NUMOD4 motif-containing HNH endonuclease n=1 Tax=Lactococcus lactis TaxID=1358 RepID=UPI00223B1678|nr:NUMOD4 motif-containing HNH endonuclease [Lactococcus lactis]MCT0449375.1 hypothetical protein [Lactococcus lactis subsp. lactis]
MIEIWKDVKGYEGLYQVSNLGQLKSLARKVPNNRPVKEKIIKLNRTTNGYMQVRLYQHGKTKTVRIHRLVAEHFLKGFLPEFDVNHIDENKSNNCADNLELSTHKENCNYGTRTERCISYKRIPIKAIRIIDNKEIYFESVREATERLGVNNISKVLTGKYKQSKGYRFEYAYSRSS